ncbi:MAG: histidine kinase [Draconibacterium sp.]|nr:histidine kinase [Draconibacterium sp.]
MISLQTQLNPHFLFNSFNTLIGLIEVNPEKGITFTEKLTDFYRNILEVGKNDLILLKEEILLLDTYIHLIRERFGEQLNIVININDIESYKIPPLTLQLLIENAVTHNTVSSKKPLHIEIKQNDKIITVTNEIMPKLGNTRGTGIGLENIKKRHTLNNLKPPTVEKSDTHFIVTIYLNKIEE